MSAHPLTSRFDDALAYAVEHHRDQRRKGSGIPYTSHLLAVTALVLEIEATEDEAIAALLHDVIEDGGGIIAEEEITERFGADVARIVRANSDSDSSPRPPWQARKKAYVEAIAHKQPDELRVSIADKLHNAGSILRDHRRLGEAVWDRFGADRKEVLWYYHSLVDAFEKRRGEIGEPAGAALDELAGIVAKLESRGPTA